MDAITPPTSATSVPDAANVVDDSSDDEELGFAPPMNADEHNEVDQLNDMYACLRQLVSCKAILMDKTL